MTVDDMENPYKPLLTGALAIAVLLGIGTFVYQHVERWPVIDAMYFSAATLTTVGYGDITPKTEIGKVFTIFFMFSGIGTVLMVMSSFSTIYLKSIESLSRREPHYKKGLIEGLRHRYRYRRNSVYR